MSKTFEIRLEDREVERLVKILTTSKSVQKSCLDDNLGWADIHDSDFFCKEAISYLRNMMILDKLLEVLTQKDEVVEGEAEGE